MKKAMEIRKYIESDRTNLIELWETCGLTRPWNDPNKDIDRKVSFQPDLFLVGIVNSLIIASAMAGYDGHRGSVFYLAVHPDYQSKGYGKILMTHIENALEKIGCPKLNIVVRSSNTPIIGFYDHLNYKKEDVSSLGKRLITDA